jgi:hypothetical protein
MPPSDEADRLRALERDFAEFRGEVRAFMQTSAADRKTLHDADVAADTSADRRHAELLTAIQHAGHAARDGLQTLANQLAIERRRIDQWEARAEGASWLVKVLPHAVTAAGAAIVGWFAAIKNGGNGGM